MKRNLLLCVICALFIGCTSDDGFWEDTSQYANVETVKLTAKPVVFDMGDGDTRTSFALSNNQLLFSWADGDTIGLFPIAPITGAQVYQVLHNDLDEGELEATFDGGAWKLKSDNTYGAYYPFQPSMHVGESYDAIPVNMLGQKQVGKNSTAHLGAYDYMIASASEVNKDTKDVNFDFDHVPGFMLFKLTLPAASWKKLVLEAASPVFITSAKMNMLDGSLKNKVYSKTMELDLENVTTTANEEVLFYLAALPVVTGNFELTAITDGNVEYKASLASKEVASGTGKGWAATLQSSSDEFDGLEYVDLGTGDGIYWGRTNVVDAIYPVYSYFCWGGTESQQVFNWSNYPLWSEYPGEIDEIEDYDPEFYVPDAYNYIDGENILDVYYNDVARSKKGKGWRMPTREEMNNLITECIWEWTTIDGVSGYKVSSKAKAARYIFLPAGGKYVDASNVDGAFGYYWTSEVEPEGYGYFNAYCLKFSETGGKKSIEMAERCIGMYVRPVYKK